MPEEQGHGGHRETQEDRRAIGSGKRAHPKYNRIFDTEIYGLAQGRA